jgi:hypothetical protein
MAAVLIVLISVMVPIVFLIASAAQKVQERKCLHQERVRALEMGLTTLPAVLGGPEVENEKKAKKSSGGGGPALHGTVWTAIGLGLLVATMVARAQFSGSEVRDFFLVVQIWAIPALFVGLGLIIYAVVTSRAAAKNGAKPSDSAPAPRQAS